VTHPPDPFLTHILACHTAPPTPADTLLLCNDTPIGRLAPEIIPHLKTRLPETPRGFSIPSGPALTTLGQDMAAEGLYKPHNELFDVIAEPGGPVLGQIDRGALPLLGLLAQGVHVNGLVARPDGLHLWMARRSLTKRLDPGKLDHLVAGGMCAGTNIQTTLTKEAEEEASIPPELSQTATPVATLCYAMYRPEGLRRDILHCFDLHLPASFTPTPADGEVETFELVPIETAFALVRDTDSLKFNVNLVLIDLFLRLGLFPAQQAQTLRNALATGRRLISIP